MKCPTCGAWSEIKETRQRSNGLLYRRRKCGNHHSFSTYETPVRGGITLKEVEATCATLRDKE